MFQTVYANLMVIVISLNPLYTICDPCNSCKYSMAEELPFTKLLTSWPLDLAFGMLSSSNTFNRAANLPRMLRANQVPPSFDVKSRPAN